MKKKIVFMLSMVYCGGVEQALLNLLDNIDKGKFDCEVLLVKKRGEYLGQFESRAVVKEINAKDYLKEYIIDETMPQLRDAKTLSEKMEYLTLYLVHQMNRITKKFFKKNIIYKYVFYKCKVKNEDIDVAIDYLGYGNFTTYYISKLSRRIQKYTWIHEQRMTDAFTWNKNRYKYFRKINAVCQDCADVFTKKFPIYSDKVGVIHNILDLEAIYQKSLEIPQKDYTNKFFILSVGRLSEQKTFDRAIEAAKILRDKGEEFCWVIIGNGPEQDRLQGLIDKYSLNDAFILHGYESNPYPYFRQADLYVQTSKAEGYCTTITEATVLGKAVVTTDVTGVYEQLSNGKGGIIVQKDSREVVQAIIELIHNRSKREQFEQYNASRNYDYVMENRKLFDEIYNGK